MMLKSDYEVQNQESEKRISAEHNENEEKERIQQQIVQVLVKAKEAEQLENEERIKEEKRTPKRRRGKNS
jgi:hypothetical protein